MSTCLKAGQKLSSALTRDPGSPLSNVTLIKQSTFPLQLQRAVNIKRRKHPTVEVISMDHRCSQVDNRSEDKSIF